MASNTARWLKLLCRADCALLPSLPKSNTVAPTAKTSMWTGGRADLRDEALEALQKELTETRGERDRYAERVVLLEARLEAVREALVKGRIEL